MDNLLDILKLFQDNKQPLQSNQISKELKEQYPYGEFPIKYTKTGQETIRKQSENRFSYETNSDEKSNQSNINLESLLPLIQTLSSGKKDNNSMMNIMSKILFKDNPQIANLFKLFPPKNNINIKNSDTFPDTNKVQINSLKRIN